MARRLHSTAVADLDPRVVRALGRTVLPSELGDPGIERAVAGFERWLAGYREGVELVHGYGTDELRYTGPSPALGWANQLSDLAAAAVKAHRTPFESLSSSSREALVRSALEGRRLGNLLQFDRAPHVALGLLGFFFARPEAADLCYQARIGANSCRPLADSPRRPLPLAGPR